MGGFHFGCYAEFVCWPEDAVLAVLPPNLSYEEAAAIPYGGLLAAHFLKKVGVRSLGATAVIDYTAENFVDRKERYDAIFDAVGKRKSREAMLQSARALVPTGKHISVDSGSPRLQRPSHGGLQQLSESGVLRPVIDRHYRLDQIVEAHRYVDQGHKKGNVVVTVC